MPYNPYQTLNAPVAPPSTFTPEVQQQYGALAGGNTTGANPVNVYDPSATGGTTGMTPDMIASRSATQGSAYTTMDVGGNVAGLTRSTPLDPSAYAQDIPEIADPQIEQENMFIDAYEKGYELQDLEEGHGDIAGTERDFWSGRWSKSGTERHANTMAAARSARRDDRVLDREQRQNDRIDAKKRMRAEYEAQGMDAKQANRLARRHSRRQKRETRKNQKASRKAAWDTFKGHRDLGKTEE